MGDVCDRCGYPVIQVDGKWTHEQAADAGLCMVLAMAERGRALQAAVDELGAGKPKPDA